MTIFEDPFFSSQYERAGRWVHHWNHAVWKKDPYCTFLVNRDEIETALYFKWLIRDRKGLRYTGPSKDKRWLLDKKKTWSTYFVEAVGQDMIKIGKSTAVDKRIDSLQIASAHELRVLAVIDGDHESAWHQRLNHNRVGGEWFHLTDDLRDAISQMGPE